MVAAKPLAIVMICLASAAIGSVIVLQPAHQLIGTFKAASNLQGCNRPPGYVSLILDSSGFNNSNAQITPGRLPTLLQFQKGETVNLLVCNFDTGTHGFAITHYVDLGVTLRAGESYKISFVARDTGSFTIYCNLLCPIHQVTLGKLVVT